MSTEESHFDAPPAASAATAPAVSAQPAIYAISPEVAEELRRLLHDLSNSLEIIVQTSYLLSLAELKEPASEWLRMLEGGVSKALEHNQSMRTCLRQNSPK